MDRPPDESTPPPASMAGPLAHDADLRRELQATIAAHQELGPQYEQDLIDAFLRRLDQNIDARIDQRLAQRQPSAGGSLAPVGALAASLALTIPLIAIAGGIAGAVGIIAVLVLVAFLNIYYHRLRS